MVTEPSDRRFKIALKIVGRFNQPDSSLLGNLAAIRTFPPDGRFEVELEPRGPVTPLNLTVVDFIGNVRQEEILIAAANWSALMDRLIYSAKRQRIIAANLSVVSTDYRQTDVRDFSQLSFNAQVSYTQFLRPKTLYAQASLYSTLLPITSSADGDSFRQIGINLRLGHYFWQKSDRWRLGLALGAFYTSASASTGDFGFAGLLAAQLNPTVLYVLSPRDSIASYLKLTPLFSPFSLADREFATGLSWTHTRSDGRAFTLGFDVSTMSFTTGAGQKINLTNLVFSAGMPFALTPLK